MVNGTFSCNKNITGGIFDNYCIINNGTEECDDFFLNNKARIVNGIPGLASDNVDNQYTEKDKLIGQDLYGNRNRGEIIADITTSFMVLLAIYFPSCTGIMAGSNRSGDLADASASIPVGTILAICTTSFVYITCVFFFAGTIQGDLLRDKFGESIDGGLVIAKLAWPTEWVILIGSFLSTLGAGLQSLTGAPRLLQAIAMDGVLPFLNVFSVTTKRGEPFRAVASYSTYLRNRHCYSQLRLCSTNYHHREESLTITCTIFTLNLFFLMCYGFVNMACALQTLLRTPSWRPRFRFYHWTLSLLGLALCITLMFISSWYYALAAILLAFCIYKYIEYKGAEKEWGDGIRGLAMSAARFALLRLQQGTPHTKNWSKTELNICKGLTLVNSVIQGVFKEKYADLQAAKQSLTQLVTSTNIKGFADVLIAEDVSEGICHLIQSAGLGGLRHNTVMVGWPYGWRHDEDERSYKVFLELEDNTIQMKKDLEMFMYNLRIEAEVDILEMSNSDISAYTYERTLMMEQRTEMLKNMRDGVVKREPQKIVDASHLSPQQVNIRLETVEEEQTPHESTTDEEKLEKHQYTFTPANLPKKKASSPVSPDLLGMKPDKKNVRRMHTAVRLNEVILDKSHESQLVILNLPAPPKSESGELNYMEFLEVLTEGLDRVLMVRGSGHEVITIYS
ncbi:hypothetical protein KUTeg_019636 [Tegillarca granosa]|uniref:Solute carrier family 12 member 6 n=1 Tax=Tegillarca granosa TaxID=220873 RepID=A0ABQ9EIM3_TEGGR|nr:hypothetical protein KUTeg_019636 [Tegillarca granosa]